MQSWRKLWLVLFVDLKGLVWLLGLVDEAEIKEGKWLKAMNW